VGSPFTNQTHDFNPGMDNGLFWTVSIPSGSVKVNPGAGKASLIVNDLELEDYHNVGNALVDVASDEASASYSVLWDPPKTRGQIRNAAIGFSLDFVTTSATMAWTAKHETPNQTFVSIGPSTTAGLSAAPLVGHGRNGKFFPGG